MVTAGSVATLGSLTEFARDERDVLLKGPAIGALVCWGEVGLVAIKEIALEDRGTKGVSGALKILAAIATGGDIPPELLFIHDDELMHKINSTCRDGRLRKAAKQQLVELVLSKDDEDLLIPIGTAFAQLSLRGSEFAAELLAAISSKWLRIGPPVLGRYEELLVKSADDEKAFHRFFVEHPHFLEPMAIQVWSKPDFHGALEPDFLIRRFDDTYLVIEIERPSKSIVTTAAQLSAECTHAEKQAVDYRDFLTERMIEVRRHFPNIKDPECLIVIGMESNLSAQQRSALVKANGTRQRIRIVGFDWLLDRAKATLSNLSRNQIEVICGHRTV